MNDEQARIAAVLQGVASDLERELVRTFGFTVLTAELAEIGADGEIRVRGTALVPRISALLRRRLCEQLSTERVRCELAPVPGAGWFRARDFPARLFRELGAGTERSLASELLSGDGPVERLAAHGTSTLVRDMCGTIGWVDAPLVGPCEPPRIAAAHLPKRQSSSDHNATTEPKTARAYGAFELEVKLERTPARNPLALAPGRGIPNAGLRSRALTRR